MNETRIFETYCTGCIEDHDPEDCGYHPRYGGWVDEKRAYTPCWTCAQPATHAFTREDSNTLHACDNCTRIDRTEAESRGWTIARDRAA